MRTGRWLLTCLSLVAAVWGTGCRSSNRDAEGPLRLGYFPNVTHGQALVGRAEGRFEKEQPGGQMTYHVFNAGPAAMEALVSGAIDAAYVGPSPAINTYLKAGGGLRVIAGSANGGAVLVTREKWSPAELKGKHLATPQLGNTQDIALRHWLKSHGLTASTGSQAGDVKVSPLSNADILGLYQRGKLDGAWVPEPWGARMLAEGGGVLLVDERELWPDGDFPSTVLVTTEDVLTKRPAQLEALMRSHVALTREWEQSPDAFAKKVNQAFGTLAGKRLPEKVLKDAYARLVPALEPPESALRESARHARALGFLSSDDIGRLIDRSLLERTLGAEPARAAARRAPASR